MGGGGKKFTRAERRQMQRAEKRAKKKATRQAWRDMSAGHERSGDGSDQR